MLMHKYYKKTYKTGVVVHEEFHAAQGRRYNMPFHEGKGYTREQAVYLINTWNGEARRASKANPELDPGVYALLATKDNLAVNTLLPALRQYRSNMTDDFVVGYEQQETETIVADLLMKIISLESKLNVVKSIVGGI
jgi:hypothetical protein